MTFITIVDDSCADHQPIFARVTNTAFWFDKERVQVLIDLYEHHQYAQIRSLHFCCEEANKRFFRSMSHPSSCIFSRLPPPRDGTITASLRSAAIYPRQVTGTKRFTSSMQYCLINFNYQ